MERITQADIEEMRNSGYDRSTIADALTRLALCQRADELIEQIAAAFAGVALDDGIGLWESDGMDDYCGPDKMRALREKDERTDWRRISTDDLNHCNAAPSFLDARGLYFHTPAFMTAELRGEFTHDFIGRLIYNSVTAPEFREFLTAAQRHAIIACISFYGSIDQCGFDSNDISNAILRYSTQKRDEIG